MKILKILLIAHCVSCLTLGGPVSARGTKARRPLVQIAVLLDTSNSMDGLITRAKTQLWKIVNEFIASKKDGQRPEIQVALVEYGKSSLFAREGFIRVIQLPGVRNVFSRN